MVVGVVVLNLIFGIGDAFLQIFYLFVQFTSLPQIIVRKENQIEDKQYDGDSEQNQPKYFPLKDFLFHDNILLLYLA